MAAKVTSRVPPRSGKKAPLVALRATKARPHVRNWLQSFLLDSIF